MEDTQYQHCVLLYWIFTRLNDIIINLSSRNTLTHSYSSIIGSSNLYNWAIGQSHH